MYNVKFGAELLIHTENKRRHSKNEIEFFGSFVPESHPKTIERMWMKEGIKKRKKNAASVAALKRECERKTQISVFSWLH